MQWSDASDTLQLCVWKCAYMCVSDSTAGEGREEEMLIEIPSAMSGRVLVSEWHTHTHFKLVLALIKVGFAIWRPCARVASLCVCLCVCPAGEACTAPQTHACKPLTHVWRCAGDKDPLKGLQSHKYTLDIQQRVEKHAANLRNVKTSVSDMNYLMSPIWIGESKNILGQVNVGAMFCSPSADAVSAPWGLAAPLWLWQARELGQPWKTSRCV